MTNKLMITSTFLIFSLGNFCQNSFQNDFKYHTSHAPQTANSILIKVKNKTILVAPKDFETAMNWEDAKIACQKLGPGWRLPNNEELEAIYNELYIKNIGNFYIQNRNLNESQSEYWSLNESKALNNEAYYFCFALGLIQNTGDSNGRDKDEEYNVRAVKVIE